MRDFSTGVLQICRFWGRFYARERCHQYQGHIAEVPSGGRGTYDRGTYDRGTYDRGRYDRGRIGVRMVLYGGGRVRVSSPTSS